MPPADWDLFKAAHLLKRAGFGGSPDQVLALYKLGLQGAVNSLLNPPDDSAQFPAPEWAVPTDRVAFRKEINALPEEERMGKRQEQQRAERQHLEMLRADWLDRMLNSPAPLREKMTLFWHGHFATSVQKVKDPYLMWTQNETLRRNALGDFGQMLRDISRDPAMVIWLDLAQNKKSNPNENFAREVMELFTLGEGNYTEEDIRNSARAFTGYRINQRNLQFEFSARDSDTGEKLFRKKKGNFTGDDILNILLSDPQCAKYICRKIWVYLVRENPAPALVAALASQLQSNKYQITPLLRTIFMSREFYAEDVIGTQIKSPVQWLVGTAAILDLHSLEDREYQAALRQLGQMLYEPPNVKGWDGGKAWISTSTLLFRYNMAGVLVKGTAMPGIKQQKSKALQADLIETAPPELRDDPKKLVRYLALRIFQTKLPEKELQSFDEYLAAREGEMEDKIAGLIHLMMSTPRYQLT